MPAYIYYYVFFTFQICG